MIYNKEDFVKLLPERAINGHKGTFGHVLNIAGSEFYTGAAYFSSVSALKVGCGLVTLSSEKTVLNSIASLTPDLILKDINKLKPEDFSKVQAVSIGCGLSQNRNAKNIFNKTIKNLSDSETPVVIDADGLNILTNNCFNQNNRRILPRPYGERAGVRGELPQNTILTPHPKEMSRLMGTSIEEILSKPEYWAKKCCEKFGCVAVLKLHETIVTDGKDDLYINNTGNSALAKGGSGDVLCGMITGFLAQGLNCFEASVLGVYLHGLTAEIASKELSEYSVLASDLLKYIPAAMKKIIKT